MQELCEFRIQTEFYHLLDKPNNGKFNGLCYVVIVNTKDPLFEQIKYLYKEIKEKYNKHFFLYSNITRKYTKKELDSSILFHIKIKSTFEPAGEECGTEYDNTAACEICGSNRKQIGLLKLKKSSVPKRDISRTISGEIVVSQKFVDNYFKSGLKGAIFQKIEFKKDSSEYSQLIVTPPGLNLTKNTIAGINIFDLSTKDSEPIEFEISGKHKIKFDKEVYKCPIGHTIGLNLISEPQIEINQNINKRDLFISQQKVGVNRNLLRTEPLYLCSPEFRKMVVVERLTGFDFEIAHIDLTERN